MQQTQKRAVGDAVPGEEAETKPVVHELGGKQEVTRGEDAEGLVDGGAPWQIRVAPGKTLAEALLTPTRIYAKALKPVFEAKLAKGAAHITGGGVPGNLTRSFPAGLGATVRRGTWHEPAIFDLIGRRGGLADDEMFRALTWASA